MELLRLTITVLALTVLTAVFYGLAFHVAMLFIDEDDNKDYNDMLVSHLIAIVGSGLVILLLLIIRL